MKILESISKKEWEEEVVSAILNDISTINGDVNILLSGGSTPGPIYRSLDRKCQDISKLRIGLVDERFVHPKDKDSNERLLRSCFNSRDEREYNIVGMVKNRDDESENLDLIKPLYAPFIRQTDIAILGMGGDGHFASIFPNDPKSDIAKSTSAIDLYATKSPNEPKRRITCSMELIANAGIIYLLISGEHKLSVLKDMDKNLPIHNLLRRRDDIKIFYLTTF